MEPFLIAIVALFVILIIGGFLLSSGQGRKDKGATLEPPAPSLGPEQVAQVE